MTNPCAVQDGRYSRQEDIVPADMIASRKAMVIGVGAIGRQVALQLASIGVPRLTLVDNDIIEESNVVTQGYHEKDIDNYKVHVTSDDCYEINTKIEVLAITDRYLASENYDCSEIFICVDSIEDREFIFNSITGWDFYCDGRMSAESIRILTVPHPFDDEGDEHPDRELYRKTFFAPSEAFEGVCTAKSTIYTANIAAGLMVSQFTKWLRNFSVIQDVSCNVLSMEMGMTV